MTSSPGTIWTPVRTADGSLTLAHPVHGETCHSVAGAWQQARERYARECRLSERARELVADGKSELHLLDIGTGLGFNLAAALDALDGTGVCLHAVSFEIDPGVIEATLELASPRALPASRHDAAACVDDDSANPRDDTTIPQAPPAGLERWHACVRAALSNALGAQTHGPTTVRLDQGTLSLVLGDARATLPALAAAQRFDAVFLDGFSPRVDPSLWEPAFLAQVARAMAPESWLSTYSAAVSVRVGLIAAGLRIGPGARVGTKAAGTIASPDQEPPPFPPRLARRLALRARLRP